jgi:ABC-type Fe3+-siderophore transport system permease subunit
MHVTTGKLRAYLTLAAAFLGAAFFLVSVMLVAFEREIEMLCVLCCVVVVNFCNTRCSFFLKGVRGRRHYFVEFSLKGGSETSCWGRDSFFGPQALIKNEG